ncbi:unnamed protein product, partial [Mesorhabditis belari]|uniref:Uncharacterized protein n=1 Tax=Mesorhabditis belari TaxID=2138241 RepID=A0AAF3F3L9_9BILA
MPQDVTDFLIDSMKIESTTGNEGNFATFIASKLREDGWFVEEQKISGQEYRMNILAKRTQNSGRCASFNQYHLELPILLTTDLAVS